MNKLIAAAIVATTLAGGAHHASATTITFDEFAASNGAPALTTRYTGSGVTFGGTNAGTWDGIAKGDPGSWGVDGTNGQEFLGFNNSTGDTLMFSSPISFISLDASQTNGSTSGTFTLNAFNGAILIDTITGRLGAINSWSSFSLADPSITSVQIIDIGDGFSPFAIDNLTFTSGGAGVPEPMSLALLGAGLAGLGVVRRRR